MCLKEVKLEMNSQMEIEFSALVISTIENQKISYSYLGTKMLIRRSVIHILIEKR